MNRRGISAAGRARSSDLMENNEKSRFIFLQSHAEGFLFLMFLEGGEGKGGNTRL